MQEYISSFKKYLKDDKNMSYNSIQAYERDVKDYEKYVKSKKVFDLAETSETDIAGFIFYLKNQGKSSATVNRKVASLRSFYSWLADKNYVNSNPVVGIKASKVERKKIEYLTEEEVKKILEIPNDSKKGIRDKAILEIMYATGIRVSELVEIKEDDVNFKLGFVTCTGEHGKARIIPIGKYAKDSLEKYLSTKIEKDEEETRYLFENYRGCKLTRQGLWKILKEYGDKAEIENPMTPQILRNSFAVHMLQHGADLKSLQELMGHEDLTATQIYLSVTKKRIKDVYDNAHPRA